MKSRKSKPHRAGQRLPVLSLLVLLVAVAALTTTPLTLAKYHTTGTGTGVARFAKWAPVPSATITGDWTTATYYIRMTTGAASRATVGTATFALNNSASETAARAAFQLKRGYNGAVLSPAALLTATPGYTQNFVGPLSNLANHSVLTSLTFQQSYRTTGYSSAAGGQYSLGFYEKVMLAKDVVQVD